LNDFLLAYGNVDVSQGDFQLFVEMAAADGKYEGYIKPFLDNLDFKDVEANKNKNIRERLWERLVSGLSTLVKNKPRDQVATRIPFSGEFGQTDVGILATIGNLLRHGFGRALSERLDGQVFAPTGDDVLKPADDQSAAKETDRDTADKSPPREVAAQEARAFEEASRRGKRP
jgi:hypothetical protein